MSGSHEERVARLEKIRELLRCGLFEPAAIAKVIGCARATIERDIELLKVEIIGETVKSEGAAAYTQCVHLRMDSIQKTKEVEGVLHDEAVGKKNHLAVKPFLELEAVLTTQVAGLEKLRGLSVERIEAKIQSDNKNQYIVGGGGDVPIPVERAGEILAQIAGPDPDDVWEMPGQPENIEPVTAVPGEAPEGEQAD